MLEVTEVLEDLTGFSRTLSNGQDFCEPLLEGLSLLWTDSGRPVLQTVLSFAQGDEAGEHLSVVEGNEACEVDLDLLSQRFKPW